jgi:signal transduction histidine kinase
MNLFSSLTNRLFLAMAVLAVLSIGAATYYATAAVTAQAEGELRRGLQEAGKLVEEYRNLLSEHFSREAALVADLPRFKATVALNDPPTLKPTAEEYRKQLGADLFVVTNAQGKTLAEVSVGDRKGIVDIVSTPILIDPFQPEILGTLTVGFSLDARAAARFRALTNSEIVFGTRTDIQAATLPADAWPALTPLLAREGITESVRIGSDEYIAATRILPPAARPEGARGATTLQSPAATAIILRSRTERLGFLSGVHRNVLLVAAAAILAAILASYAIARTVTRPLGAVTATMREMGATGDLTRRIPLPAGARWEDEDARLLASTFNSMTASISRFQRDAAQRERLSALGRLSTVVAHEIRNPLMIIKTSLHGLRRDGVTPGQVREAVANIEEEVARLNRIVSEVLDFARPIKFAFAPLDLNALCADAARAAAPEGAADIRLDLAPGLPPVVSDSDRLRLALVNILTNARHAVAARGEPAPEPIRLSTAARPDGRVVIAVRDRGVGINQDELTRIFDPFFTTRSTGTGLGLAITRNIIEGMGGSISISSTPGRGTDVRVELPSTAAPV